MKKIFINTGIVFAFLLSALMTNTVNAQNGKPSLTIGNGNWSQYMCFYNYYKNNRTQVIYTSSELGAGKVINQIGLNFNMLPTQEEARQFTDLKINIKHTSTSEFPEGTSDFEDMAGATQVLYSPLYTLPSNTGVHYFDIDDFMYNGTDNLIIEFIWGPNPDYSSDLVRELCERDETAPITYRVATGYSDWDTPPEFSAISEFRPNLYIYYENLPTGTTLIEDGAGTEITEIPSITDTQAEATLLNFDFKITDDGTNPDEDTNPLKISKIIIQKDANDEIADWSEVIGGAIFSDGTNTQTADITINSQNITIENIPFGTDELGFIADNGQKTYTLNIWLKSDISEEYSDIIDGKKLVFKITPLNDIILESGSSFFELGQSINSGSANNEITVTATQLAFVENMPPTIIATDEEFNVSLKATDENGNRDLDNSCSATLSLASGNGNFSSVTGLTQTLANGLYQWTDCVYDTEETLSLSAEGCSLIGGNSIDFQCYNSVCVGEEVYGTSIPFDNNNENYRAQIIYLSSELGGANTLTHLGFNFKRISPEGYRDFDNMTIKIKHTSSTEFAGATFEDMSGATTVLFNSDYDMPTNTGWYFFDIEDFAYNGTDNLLLEIYWGDNDEYVSYGYQYNVYGFDSGTMRTASGYSSYEIPQSPNSTHSLVPTIRFRYETEVSVDNISDDFTVNIYPNPSNTGIFNCITGSKTSINNIIITDVTGKIVRKLDYLQNNTLDLSDFGKGIYFLKANIGLVKINKKLIIN